MIRLEQVSKSFFTKHGEVRAVDQVDLNIKAGEVFGIIGYSGAGKSTLVRCINLLERPQAGKVFIKDVELTSLKPKSLRIQRQKIGMIFQQFNLLTSRTVFENVAFPLRHHGHTAQEVQLKVNHLLKIVGLTDKTKAYPSQLSGGQKQRVAIARALANDPDILLCDEATSALDPQTTESILKLLKELNQTLNLTIVIITHEMKVIKDICDQVAIMEDGHVIEQGRVAQIFADPKAQLTKDFIGSISNLSKINDLIDQNADIVSLTGNQQLLRLDFHGESTKEAIISEVSKRFTTSASIIFANVEVIQHTIIGTLIIILDGTIDNQKEAIDYLKNQDIRVEVLKHA